MKDLTQFAIGPEHAPVVERRHQSEAVKRAAERRRKHFVLVPLWWIETLTANPHHATTMATSLHVLYQDWRHGGKPFPLGQIPGISRWRKRRALDNLEGMGLVTVKWRAGRPPLIRVLARP
jgi:hypothetical protein